jgi:serine/threonine protein kinase/Flp pilus assembly protein TadD
MLGEFAILRPLASGGMGQVYLARQESLGRLVALKVCKPEIARDPRMKSRFVAEALSLAQLNHPNVVPVLSTGEDQGYLYLAMEYIAGPTLARVLEAIQAAGNDSLASTVVSRVLTSPDKDNHGQLWGNGHARLDRSYQTWAIQTLQQVAQGLAGAHAAGILHRDIKPANIVFAANGVPKIVDFGLARTPRTPSTTVAGEFYGTPAYTSPEQARGDVEALSPASDVFSFGITLFECLTLERPFAGRTAVDVLSAVANSDAPLLRRVEKRIPWELEAITDKCLRKRPADRYLSAQALADDLRNYLELRPVAARPASKISRVGRMIRRRPWVAAFLLAFGIALVLGMFLAKNAWAEYKAEKLKTFAKLVDDGDIALFRCLTGQRPTWLPAVIEQYRQEGIRAYTAALVYDQGEVRPLVQRARLYASEKETLELALADLDKAQRLQPGFASIRKFRAHVLDELYRKDEAQVAKEEAKNLYPTIAEDLYWLGVIAYSKEQDFDAAYKYFSQALLLIPNDYWSRMERAHWGRMPSESLAISQQRMVTEFDIAKSIRPELPFASEYLVMLHSLEPGAQKKELAEQIERFGLDVLRAHRLAELLQKENKNGEAEEILLKVLDQDTGGWTAELMGDLEYRTGHYQSASEWYSRAINQGKSAWLPLAKSFTAMKDWKAAEQVYLDEIATHPNDPSPFWNLGSWYEARGRVTDAEKTYRKGCELPIDRETSAFSGASLSYQLLAGLLDRSGRGADRVLLLEQGIARLEKALGKARWSGAEKALVAGNVFTLKQLLGQGYIFMGRRQDALSLIEANLKLKPITPEQAGMLANLYGLLGMHQEALEAVRLSEFTAQRGPAWNDATRLAPTKAVDRQLFQLGLHKELLGRLESMKALGDDLADPDYRLLGGYYQGADALAILSEGLKRYPTSVGLHSDYMQALAKAGRKDEAWKAYENGRDLYFAEVAKSQIPSLPGDPPPPTTPLWLPGVLAIPWYTYLVQEGKLDELKELENRLREACVMTRKNPEELTLARASAEFTTQKYAAAVKSLEFCLQQKIGNEAWITSALGQSLRALGRKQEAIKYYRRAVELSDVDPKLVSEFLCLIVEVQGIEGLKRDLPAFEKARLKPVARLHATLECISAWAALATGDEKAAFEFLVTAGTWMQAASHDPHLDGDELLTWGVLLNIVAERLGDSRRLAVSTELLKRFPAERVNAKREVFLLPKRK